MTKTHFTKKAPASKTALAGSKALIISSLAPTSSCLANTLHSTTQSFNFLSQATLLHYP